MMRSTVEHAAKWHAKRLHAKNWRTKNWNRYGLTAAPREAGYALLMAMFIVATVLLMAAAAAPNLLTQGRRAKEEELMWRGGQYVRAIRLYYKKNSRYPQNLDDLIKGDAVGVHYLRKPYKDPVNAADGNWRLIYVSPSGQLTGSVHYHSLQEMAAAMIGLPLPGAGAAAAPGTGQQSGTGLQTTPQSTQAMQFGAQGGAPGSQLSTTAQAGQGTQDGRSSTQPQPVSALEAVNGPVLGGFAIGVASKIKKPSVRVYQGWTTYFDWEFIWNPLLTPGGTVLPTNAATPGANGSAPGSNVPGQPGQPGQQTQPGTTNPAGVPTPGNPQGVPGAPQQGAPPAPPQDNTAPNQSAPNGSRPQPQDQAPGANQPGTPNTGGAQPGVTQPGVTQPGDPNQRGPNQPQTQTPPVQ